MRIALIVGINRYDHIKGLHGCVADALAVKEALEYHQNGHVNFECKVLTCSGPEDSIDRKALKDRIAWLFKVKAEIALLYFAGHGHVEETGGYLLASDSRYGDEGLALSDIIKMAKKSRAENQLIILDSCHSGVAGSVDAESDEGDSILSTGMTILTASTKDQYATEKNGRGLFTSLLVDALNGGAANLTGHITPGSVYAHIDQSLSGWEQRPVFKTNVERFVSLKQVKAPISIRDLRRISKLFPEPDFVYKLDPTYEPEMKGRDKGMPRPKPENCRTFACLQKYNRLNLLVPVGAPHMWHAAMKGKGCKLTALGEHYRRLAEKKRL